MTYGKVFDTVMIHWVNSYQARRWLLPCSNKYANDWKLWSTNKRDMRQCYRHRMLYVPVRFFRLGIASAITYIALLSLCMLAKFIISPRLLTAVIVKQMQKARMVISVITGILCGLLAWVVLFTILGLARAICFLWSQFLPPLHSVSRRWSHGLFLAEIALDIRFNVDGGSHVKLLVAW